ncbi:MAG: carbohydrate binding family 9 domain-containing protein [Gammaproteobacteria bacterium]|nr:carbohydrate binding family 9 domain-containing protein [Gammaproteobacteria bacterium]MYK46271.1 carbohydrate binding family 9 domain-containing protein [Gammaproteobacteria bacterium]
MQFPRSSFVAIMFLVGAASAAETSNPPHGQATPLTRVPTLDGNVADDPAWEGLTPFTGFTQLQPDNGAPASQRTEVYFGFTEDALHIGVICFETDPAAITVSNDGFQSDSFSMVLDTFSTGLAGMVFGTNPVGAEYDGQVADEFADWNWSTLWQVRTRTHEAGWSAELAIPFQSLRYGTGDVQSWRVNFARVIRRNNEISYWSPVPRQFSMFRLSLAGRIDGIHVPRQRRNLEVTPYLLGRANRGGSLSRPRQDDDFGFDMKYSITPSLTLDLTYNTDFAQVESDRQQVNLGRFSLFFPETRPFFLENAGSFSVGTQETQLFHSRRIGIAPDGRRLPIEAGVRVSGKVGAATNLGFLHMRAEAVTGIDSNDFTVARLSRDLSNRSSLGFIATDRRGPGSSRQTYGLDGSLGLGANGQLRAIAARTRTPGVESDDHAVSLFGTYNSTEWTLDSSYAEVGAGFDPAVGFVGRRDYRSTGFFAMRKFLDAQTLREWRPLVAYQGYWDFEGYYESGNLHLESWWVWKSAADVWPAVNFSHEGVKHPFTIAGVTVPAGDYETRDFEMGINSAPNKTWSGGAHMTAGGFYNGKRHAISPYINYRRDETLSAWAGWDHNTIDLGSEEGSFTVNLARAGLSYSFTPKIGLRALIQYNDADDVFAANVRFSWLRSANAGLYVVYNEIDARTGLGKPGRELVLKYSHIFDVL